MNSFKRENLALVLSKSRTQCGKSQKYMAQTLGKSVGTIQNWESGFGAPNVVDFVEWFHILNLEPIRFVLDVLYPCTFSGLSDRDSISEVRKRMCDYVSNTASDDEIRKMAFCLFGNTGSSWLAQLDMLTAHNHTTLKSRVFVAQVIENNYEIEKARGELRCPECILPNEERLHLAIVSGKESACANRESYSTASKNEDPL